MFNSLGERLFVAGLQFTKPSRQYTDFLTNNTAGVLCKFNVAEVGLIALGLGIFAPLVPFKIGAMIFIAALATKGLIGVVDAVIKPLYALKHIGLIEGNDLVCVNFGARQSVYMDRPNASKDPTQQAIHAELEARNTNIDTLASLVYSKPLSVEAQLRRQLADLKADITSKDLQILTFTCKLRDLKGKRDLPPQAQLGEIDKLQRRLKLSQKAAKTANDTIMTIAQATGMPMPLDGSLPSASDIIPHLTKNGGINIKRTAFVKGVSPENIPPEVVMFWILYDKDKDAAAIKNEFSGPDAKSKIIALMKAFHEDSHRNNPALKGILDGAVRNVSVVKSTIDAAHKRAQAAR
jgi:hypothetical protein